MTNLIEQLAAKVLADEKELQASHELLDRLREFESASANVKELEQKHERLQGEISGLEERQRTLKSIDHAKLLPAVEAAILLYSIHVKPLPPDARRKLEDSYLRASGYIMVNAETFRDASGTVLVRKPALDRAINKSVEPLWSEIVAGLKAREDVVLGRAPAKVEGAVKR
jgi:hypothetical protein